MANGQQKDPPMSDYATRFNDATRRLDELSTCNLRPVPQAETLAPTLAGHRRRPGSTSRPCNAERTTRPWTSRTRHTAVR